MSSSASFLLPALAVSSAATIKLRVRRYLDAKTRDYAIDGSALKQDDGFTSKVVLALCTRLGSAQAFPAFGSRLHEIKRADERGRRLAEKHALRALSHLTGEIADLTVTASISAHRPDAIELDVRGKKAMVVLSARYTAVVGR